MLFVRVCGLGLHTSPFPSHCFLRQQVLSIVETDFMQPLASTLSDLISQSSQILLIIFTQFCLPRSLRVSSFISSLSKAHSFVFLLSIVNTGPINPGHPGSRGFSVSFSLSVSVFINLCPFFFLLTCALSPSLSSPPLFLSLFSLFCPRRSVPFLPLSSS